MNPSLTDRPIEAWSALEVGAAALFALVAGINFLRFGVGPEASAGVAGAVAVLIPRQFGQHVAAISWYVAPIAMVGLQAKILGGCAACTPQPAAAAVKSAVIPAAAALAALLLLAMLVLLRLPPVVRSGLAATAFLGQAVMLMASPSLCVACLLATAAVAGIAAAGGPPRFAAAPTFRHVIAGAAALGVLTGGVVAAGGPSRSDGTDGRIETVSAVHGLARIGIPDGAVVVVGAPGCPACAEAERFIKDHRLPWAVRYPCAAGQVEGCWTPGPTGWRLPTLLRREGDRYRILARGFSAAEWESFR